MRSLKHLAFAGTTAAAAFVAFGTTAAHAVHVELSPPVVIESGHHRDYYTGINSRHFKQPALTTLIGRIRATPSPMNNAAAEILEEAIRTGDIRADYNDGAPKSKGTKRKQPGPDTQATAAAGPIAGTSSSSSSASSSSSSSSSVSAHGSPSASSSSSSSVSAHGSPSASSSSSSSSSTSPSPAPVSGATPHILPAVPTSEKIKRVLQTAQAALAKGDAGAAQRELAAIANVSATALVAEDGPVSLRDSWREFQALRHAIWRGGLGPHVYFSQPLPTEAGREVAHQLFLANQEATQNNPQAAQEIFNTAQTKFIALVKTTARPDHEALVKRWKVLIAAVETKIARDESFAREIFGPTGVPKPVEIGLHPEVLPPWFRFFDPPNPKTELDFDLDALPFLPVPMVDDPPPAVVVPPRSAVTDADEQENERSVRGRFVSLDDDEVAPPPADPAQAGLPVYFGSVYS